MNRLRDWFGSLTRRERILAGCGLGAILMVLLVAVVQGVRGKMARERVAIVQMQKDMEQLNALAAEYRQTDAALQAVDAQISNSSLEKVMGTLEKIASEEGLGDRIEAMKPKATAGTDPDYEEIAVEVHLVKMDTDALVRFLFKVETSPGYIKVKRLKLTGKGDPGSRSLDAIVQVSTFSKRKA